METTKRAREVVLADGDPASFEAALCRDVDTLEEALEAGDKTIGLCQSFASNTSGGMNAETRLRRIYELCCRARAVL